MSVCPTKREHFANASNLIPLVGPHQTIIQPSISILECHWYSSPFVERRFQHRQQKPPPTFPLFLICRISRLNILLTYFLHFLQVDSSFCHNASHFIGCSSFTSAWNSAFGSDLLTIRSSAVSCICTHHKFWWEPRAQAIQVVRWKFRDSWCTRLWFHDFPSSPSFQASGSARWASAQ